MKRKALFYTAFIYALLSIRCVSDKPANDGTKLLTFPTSGEDTLKVSLFADTVFYIPLETTKESFIQFIEQVWMNDTVILLDSGGKVLMFRQDGKFIRQIGKQGRGPGEYLSIFHFDVIRDTVYISSSGRRGFLRYTLDGTFCDEIRLDYQPVYFSTTADHKLACYVHPDGKIYVYNKYFSAAPDTIIVEYGVTIGRRKYIEGLRPGYSYLQKTPSGLLFNSFLSDTIWNIADDKKEPAFILNLRDKLLPYDKQIEFSNGDFTNWHNMASHYSIIHLIPFSVFTFVFQLHHSVMSYDPNPGYDAIYLCNNITGEFSKYNTSCIYDDIVSGQELSNERLTYFFPMYFDDYLVTVKKSQDVLDYLKLLKESNKEVPSLLWVNQMKYVKEGDNPILIKIKVRRISDE